MIYIFMFLIVVFLYFPISSSTMEPSKSPRELSPEETRTSWNDPSSRPKVLLKEYQERPWKMGPPFEESSDDEETEVCVDAAIFLKRAIMGQIKPTREESPEDLRTTWNDPLSRPKILLREYHERPWKMGPPFVTSSDDVETKDASKKEEADESDFETEEENVQPENLS